MKELPPFEDTISASLIAASESITTPLRTILREFGVTEPQWRVLRVINDRGQSDASSIAEIGLLHASSVSRIVQELEERGLLHRTPVPGDRRRRLFTLSDTGREMVDGTSGLMGDVLDDFTGRFGEQRMQALLEELRWLSASIKGVI